MRSSSSGVTCPGATRRRRSPRRARVDPVRSVVIFGRYCCVRACPSPRCSRSVSASAPSCSLSPSSRRDSRCSRSPVSARTGDPGGCGTPSSPRSLRRGEHGPRPPSRSCLHVPGVRDDGDVGARARTPTGMTMLALACRSVERRSSSGSAPVSRSRRSGVFALGAALTYTGYLLARHRPEANEPMTSAMW